MAALHRKAFSRTSMALHRNLAPLLSSSGAISLHLVATHNRYLSMGIVSHSTMGRSCKSTSSRSQSSDAKSGQRRFSSVTSQSSHHNILTANWPVPIPSHFGLGRINDLPTILRDELKVERPLLVCDGNLANTPVIGQIKDTLSSNGIEFKLFSDVVANPTDVNIYDGRRAFLEHKADSLIAVGGGSGLDAGKSIAMSTPIMADATKGSTTKVFTLDELEWIKEEPALEAGTRLPPVITIPTTSGTGAEMDSASMYTDTKKNVKFCVRHSQLSLQTILDPMLTVSLPKKLTAWTGMDALTHAIEAFLSNTPEGMFGAPVHDAVALESLRLINLHLLNAVAQPDDLAARSGMLVASSLAAVSFGIKGLGAVHGLSEPVGAVYNTQHGLTNAVLLPYFLRFNYQLAASDGKDSMTLQELNAKCERIANYIGLARQTTNGNAFEAVLEWVLDLRQKLEIPNRLADLGVKASSCQELALKANQNPTGFTNFPRPLTTEEYVQVIEEAM